MRPIYLLKKEEQVKLLRTADPDAIAAVHQENEAIKEQECKQSVKPKDCRTAYTRIKEPWEEN